MGSRDSRGPVIVGSSDRDKFRDKRGSYDNVVGPVEWRSCGSRESYNSGRVSWQCGVL